jgi:hypothetical protein
MLLSAEDIQRASNTSAHSIEFFVEAGISAGYEALSRGHLQSCWVVGGNIMQLPDQESAELHATLIWCPDLPIEHRYLSSLSQTFYPTFREALLEHAIRMSAF